VYNINANAKGDLGGASSYYLHGSSMVLWFGCFKG